MELDVEVHATGPAQGRVQGGVPVRGSVQDTAFLSSEPVERVEQTTERDPADRCRHSLLLWLALRASSLLQLGVILFIEVTRETLSEGRVDVLHECDAARRQLRDELAERRIVQPHTCEGDDVDVQT